jgi:hypothetical protein
MIFENKPGEMIDVLVENNTFRPISTYKKVSEFLAEDVISILLKEKTGLNDYHTLKAIRIIEKYQYYEPGFLLPQEVGYYQVHISCTHNGFSVVGTENIEDLPQKIREIKLEKILNE